MKIILLFLFFYSASFCQSRKSAAEEVTARLDTIENYLKGKNSMNIKLPNSITCLTGITPKKGDGTYAGWIYYPTLEEVTLWRKWLEVNKNKLFYGVLSKHSIGYDEVIVKFEDGTTRSSYCKQALPLTATTTDLGIWLNGKMVLYLDDLANPNNGLNLVPNPLQYQDVIEHFKKPK